MARTSVPSEVDEDVKEIKEKKHDPYDGLDEDIAEEDEYLRCTVLHGYGRVEPTKINFLEGYQFVGGVGRNIPLKLAKRWRASGTVKIYILRPEATEKDFVKKAGITPMAPEKIAAQIAISDINRLVESLGRDNSLALVKSIEEILNKR